MLLIVLGLLGAVAAVALVLSQSAKATRKASRLQTPPWNATIIGGARVGAWYASWPLAELHAAETAVLVKGHVRFVPIQPYLIERSQVARVETRPNLTGGECLRFVGHDGNPVSPFLFFSLSKRASSQLSALGWDVEQVRGRSRFGWT